MKSFRIEATAVQNWSCHGCTACCRGMMMIELSDEEARRIQGQGWTKADGVDPEAMLARHEGRLRLGHQSDGACVFLDAGGRCRIHARFGEAAKPRACRLFPLALHPAGKKLVVGVRFSCPSAAANSGAPLGKQIPMLRELAELVVPDDYAEFPPPRVLAEGGLEWPDFMRYVSHLDKAMAAENQPVARQLQRALHWLGEVEKAGFDRVSGRGAEEILGALWQDAGAPCLSGDAAARTLTRMDRLLFRTLVFTYARKDSMRDLATGGLHRLRMLSAMLKWARGAGRVPGLIAGLRPVDFAEVEKPFGKLPAGAEAALRRFFRVKIQSLHFCGRAYYGLPLIEGFQHLALLCPVILWLAQWHAVAENRATLSEKDIERAMTLADHHHGYSPILAGAWSRRRARLLARRDGMARLCGAYSA